MSRFVDIPVRCVSEECKNCEDLEIVVDRLCGFGADLRWVVKNDCHCEHYCRCERLIENLRKNSNSDNEKDGV